MFIPLKHKSLDVYQAIREVVKESYKISLQLPPDEKFNMVQQIRRAALSVNLTLQMALPRKSILERKRYFEISRGSLAEIDAALETAFDLNYFTSDNLQCIGLHLNKRFAMLLKMISH